MTQIKRIGVLGAGQLALMLAEAAPSLGVEVICAGSPEDCAARVAEVIPTDLDDVSEVRRFASQVDLVTVESENISADVLQGLKLQPNLEAVRIAQDRLLEKTCLQECGVETATFAPVSSESELERALDSIGVPSILKTRRLGYDGKGQVRLGSRDEAADAWAQVYRVPCILEGRVEFAAEVSLVSARGYDGRTVHYPLAQNQHREGILRRSDVPSCFPELQPEAEQIMERVLRRLGYVGVLAVEFFVSGGKLIANEMAPRVHNSGHWTIEGSETSQFANHLRAIAGMPLGAVSSTPTVMLNCIGAMPARSSQGGGAHWHEYGKEARAGRKVGHLTFDARQTAAIAIWEDVLARD